MQGKILVLDDEENYAEMLQGLLRQNHFDVDMATKPELALEALEEFPYALVISDYKMPIMDGAVFLKKAREIYPDLPVILVSGLMNTPELVKVANMGVTMVLEKPLDTHYFLEQVGRFVAPMSEAEEKRLLEAPEVEAEDLESSESVEPRPAEVLHLAGASQLGRRLLDRIWTGFREHHLLTFTGPEGSEWDLALKEIAGWKGESGQPHAYYSAGQLRKESVQTALKALAADGEHSTIVAVGDLGTASAEDRGWLATFLLDAGSSMGLTFAVWLDDPALLKVETGAVLITIPPLTDRPEDLAAYAVRYLRRFYSERTEAKPPAFSAEASHLLLHYSWPGNFGQLVKAMRKLAREVNDEPVSAAQLSRVLKELAPGVAVPEQRLDLEEVLIRRQQEILKDAAIRQGISERKILSRLGFDVSALPEDAGVEALDLLYPEVLESVDR